MKQIRVFVYRMTPFLQNFVWIGIAVTFLSGCSSGLKMTSERRQSDVVIDGSDAEWQSGLYYDKESDAVYSVRNDDEYLYVFLKTQNRSTQMQIMRGGFTVWFDGDGGKKHSFGIRFPLGGQHGSPDVRPDADEEQMHTMLDQVFGECEILGPQSEDVQRSPTMDVHGVRVKIGRTRDALVYELRVPFTKTSDHPYAVNPTAGNRLGIGFEAAEFKRGEMKGGPPLNSGFGGTGPMEGAGMGEREEESRGHSGGYHGGALDGAARTKQMTLWLAVQLAM